MTKIKMEYKNCPYCGMPGEIIAEYKHSGLHSQLIGCKTISCRGNPLMSPWADSPQEAEKRWNERANENLISTHLEKLITPSNPQKGSLKNMGITEWEFSNKIGMPYQKGKK